MSQGPAQRIDAGRWFASLGREERKRIIAAIEKRRWRIAIVPAAVALLSFLGWMFLFGVGGDRLAGTRFDFMGFLNDQGITGIILGILLGYGVAVGLALGLYRMTRRAMLEQEAGRCLAASLCLWCGHSLIGTALKEDDSRRCPECGHLLREGWTRDLPRKQVP